MRIFIFVLLALLATLPNVLSAGDSPRIIEIKAKKFEYSPKEIHLKKGEPVILRFETLDRKHGFKVPNLGIEAIIKPGETTDVKILPEKVGVFKFHCHLFCGSGHEDMNGVIYVE